MENYYKNKEVLLNSIKKNNMEAILGKKK